MVLDRSDHEPEEWDPEEEFADPDSDSLTIPRVDTEDAGSGLRADLEDEFESDLEVPEVATVDVDPAVSRAFWGLVLVINAAVLALALGALLLFFEGASTESAALLGGGAILSGFAVYRFRSARETIAGDGTTDVDSDDRHRDSAATEPASGRATDHLDDDTRR